MTGLIESLRGAHAWQCLIVKGDVSAWRNTTAPKEAADALEALKGYAVHDEGCGTQMYLNPRRCDCGLHAILAKLGGE